MIVAVVATGAHERTQDRHGRARRRLQRLVVAGALMCAALLSPYVPLSHGSKLPGPTSFQTGLTDDSLFEFADNPTRLKWLNVGRAIGSTTVKLNVTWTSIAPLKRPAHFNPANPADPNYNWTNLDASVKAAAQRHQSLMLQLYAAPLWAEAPGGPDQYEYQGSWEPKASDYGQFAHAVAARYNGKFPDPLRPGRKLPRVRYFQAWNEPNLPEFLMPQWERTSKGALVAESPVIYRKLLNAFYSGVKSAQRKAYVLAAGTAPYGDPPSVGNRMFPLTFLRTMLCLSPSLHKQRCPNRAHFDALAHHPYALAPTIHAKVRGDISVPDLPQLLKVMKAARKYKLELPKGPKQLWVTEIDWSTDPTVRHPITPAVQARYLLVAFYEFWREGVSHVYWFDLVDPLHPMSSDVDVGLFTLSGKAKPSAAAFHFPFVALRERPAKRILWGKAPKAGTVTVQRKAGKRWLPVLRIKTTKGAIFYRVIHINRDVILRAHMGRLSSLAWLPGLPGSLAPTPPPYAPPPPTP